MSDSRRAAAATVREALRARGIRQSDLAQHLGLSQPAVSNRLTGHTAFALDELDKIADLLGVPVSQLLEPPALLVDDDESEGGDQGA